MKEISYAIEIDITGLSDKQATKVRDVALIRIKKLCQDVEKAGARYANWTPTA